MLDSNKVGTIVGIIVGIFSIIGGLYAFFTKLEFGKRCWSGLGEALKRFGRFYSNHWKKLTVLLLILIGLAVTYYRLRTKEITGTVYYYYRQCEGNPGLDPAANVTVFISARRDLKSDPTDPSGKFVIKGIPAGLQINSLTGQIGGQDFPTAVNEAGTYPIIPRPCPTPLDYRDVSRPWVEGSANECVDDSGQQLSKMKRFLLDYTLPAAQNKREAILTVEVQGAGDVVIANAFVILPTAQPGLYRNAMQGIDPRKSHRWLFTLPAEGLRVKLEVCLGSNNSSAIISMADLHTYYELR